MKHLVAWLNHLIRVYLLGLCLWIGCRFLWFDQFWWLALLNTHAIFLLLPTLLVLPYVIWQKRWKVLAVVMVPLVFLGHWFAPLFLPQAIAPIGNAMPLRMMTFNVLWDNQDYAAIVSSIRRTNPDVIGLQELRPEHVSDLQAKLKADYPYSVVHPKPDFHTVGVLSRWPLEDMQTLENPPIERGLQVRLKLPNQVLVQLLVTHLAPNNMFTFSPDKWLPLTRQRYAQRMQQVKLIQTIVKAQADPVVMLCDCNMSETSQTYTELRRVFRDSFHEVGWGLGHTLLGPLAVPIQRIDFVWYRPPKQSGMAARADQPHNLKRQSMHAHRAYVGNAAGSDHLPLVVDLSINH